jgi:SIR2-like domain
MTSRTNNTTSDTVLSTLHSDFQNGHVAVFLGAGLSAALAKDCMINGFNLASWGGLILHGARWAQDWCGYEEGFSKSVALDIAGDMNSMLAAAEKVSRALKDNNEFGKWLRCGVGKLEYSSQAADLASLLKTFAAKQIPLITTNYDSLLEEATELDSITWKDKVKLHRQLVEGSPSRASKIIHLHGHYETPDSVVLGIQDYRDLLDSQFLDALRTLLGLTKSLLFVGFGKGLDDPHFSKLIGFTQNVIGEGDQRIYRLCRTQERRR